jgi:hypothetical protein
MKHVISAKVLIIALVLSNLGSALYIYRHWSEIHPAPKRSALAKRSANEGKGESYNRGAIKEAMATFNSQFESCYDAFLHTEPEKSEGSVVVNWIIGKNGEVESPTVMKSELKNQELHDCLTQQLQSLKFAAPVDGEVAVAHKFNFMKRSPAQVVFQ